MYTVPFRLSLRLRTVLAEIKDADLYADIGTDHAWLPIAWLATHPHAKAIGIDLESQPLVGAHVHRERAGLTDRLELRRGDGIKALATNEPVQVLSICGMGGERMTHILQRGLTSAPTELCRLVLQPNDRSEKVRAILPNFGFRLVWETALWERNQYYCVLITHRCAEAIAQAQWQSLTAAERKFGPILLREQNPALDRRLRESRARLQAILEACSEARNPSAKARAAELDLIETALRSFEQ